MRTAVGVRRDFAKSFGVGCSPSDLVGEPDVTVNQISCAGALPQREVIPHQFTATLSALEMRYMLVSIPADPGFDEKLSRAVLRVSTPQFIIAGIDRNTEWMRGLICHVVMCVCMGRSKRGMLLMLKLHAIRNVYKYINKITQAK